MQRIAKRSLPIKNILLFLFMALLTVSCGTVQPVVQNDDPGVLVHEPSGLIIPADVGIWRQTESHRYSEDGYDMSYNYVPVSGDHALATLYIYPAGQDLSEEDWLAHYDDCKNAIFTRYPNGEIVDETTEYPTGKTIIRYQANGMYFMTILTLTTVNGWHLKYRITADDNLYGEVSDDIGMLIESRYLPEIPLGSY